LQALFDPPPFKPEKLSVAHIGSWGCSQTGSGQQRRYTLTHNDITGALKLTVGPDYNQAQISGFYTRLLRDEVIAEWRFGPQGPALHVYCHVSGEERWLAPPLLRNYIFRRELPLVGGHGPLLQGQPLMMVPSAQPGAAISARCTPIISRIPQLCIFFLWRRGQVLDTFLYADREWLASQQGLRDAEVYVHFQSTKQVRCDAGAC
jgi:hypothetical protein